MPLRNTLAVLVTFAALTALALAVPAAGGSATRGANPLAGQEWWDQQTPTT